MSTDGHVIVLVDHGSRVAAANEATERLGEQLAQRTGTRVIATHMELAEPEFAATLDELAQDENLSRLTVLPLFFTAGKHWCEDIEGPVEAFAKQRTDVEHRLTSPIAEQVHFLDYLATLIDAGSG